MQPLNTGNVGKTWGQPFQKGVSGNPGGKAKGTVSLLATMRRLLATKPEGEKRKYAELIVRRTLDEARRGDSAALALVWKYAEGLPVAKLPEGAAAGIMFMITAPEGVEEPDIIDVQARPPVLGPGDISPDSEGATEP